MRGRRVRLVASLVLMVCVASPVSSAAAFGTIDSAGQHREHERITRASLDCSGSAGSEDDCFEPASMDFLAGHDREFGAVGAPDSDEVSDPAAHCDGADFLASGYPRTRAQATAALMDCVDHLRMRFGEAVDRAAELLDDEGRVIEDEVDLGSECRMAAAAESRAKCATLEALGRVLHGVQDFYSHSNWADEADPTRAIGDDNPPGLDLPGPSPVLDLRSETPPVVPPGLSTGCYVLRDTVPGVGECEERVTHAALNKDTGLIDPDTGAATEPTKPRGMVGENFAKAVAGAIAETRRQWQDLRDELIARYGEAHAAVMICALTHDDPGDGCRDRGWLRVLVGILAGSAVLATVMPLFRARRRRRTRAPGVAAS
jgi:hypothetical protein